METGQRIKEIAEKFAFDGEIEACVPYGNGHINDTYRLTCRIERARCGDAAGGGQDAACPQEENGFRKDYILQRMSRTAFADPEALMENIVGVTEWLKKKIRESGGDPERETLNLIRARDGKSFYRDSEGEYWRMYLFISHAVSLEMVRSGEDFYQSAVAFGNFQRMLAEYPAETLHETIKDFHNTADRLRKFEASLDADVCGRANKVTEEIRFVLERRELAHVLTDLQRDHVLPLRVTHNDTKLNNILFDAETGRAICVIDLDTVMPGLSVNDFGDSIRFGASTAEEDERDLNRVSCDLELYKLYVKGFIEGCGGALTREEIDMLPMGAILMTFECGIRFLTDYLDGDHYFKIQREDHNLDRARTQFRLVADMEKKLPQMQAIVEKYRV